MNDSKKSQLKILVKTRINQLRSLLHQDVDYSTRKMQQEDDKSASLDITINSEVDSQLLENYRSEILSLSASLAWLDSEEAGYCSDCGCEIPFTRLVAVPDTQLCVECAGKK